jgi:hypothetical protein
VETAFKTTFLYQQLTFTQKDFFEDQEDVDLRPFPFSPTLRNVSVSKLELNVSVERIGVKA